MGLLVGAYEHCRGEEDSVAPALDREGLKSLVRELDLWCSSCMVALEGREPVAVLLGAKRDTATLVYGMRVHPLYRRRGHGRHLLTSLGQKLAILGPDRLVAEVSSARNAACLLATACGWQEERRLRDWRRSPSPASAEAAAEIEMGGGVRARLMAESEEAVADVGFQHLLDAGVVAGGLAWHRDLATLERRGDRTLALAFHSMDRIEAWLLAYPAADDWEIVAAGCEPGELGTLGLRTLVERLATRAGSSDLVLRRWAEEELSPELLRAAGFVPEAEHILFATRAKAA